MGNSDKTENIKTDNKNLKKSKIVDPELERLRLRRMQKVMAFKREKEVQNQQIESFQQKIDIILKVILTPDANIYLEDIRGRNNLLFNKIKQTILPAQIVSQIDLLITYLRQGMLRGGIISITDIKYMERQLLGIKSKITIKKRNQESTDLASFLKKN